MQSLGSYLRACRIARGMTQEELGQAVGYTPGVAYKIVQSWEHDRQWIPMHRIRAVAKVLQIPVESLIP